MSENESISSFFSLGSDNNKCQESVDTLSLLFNASPSTIALIVSHALPLILKRFYRLS